MQTAFKINFTPVYKFDYNLYRLGKTTTKITVLNSHRTLSNMTFVCYALLTAMIENRVVNGRVC